MVAHAKNPNQYMKGEPQIHGQQPTEKPTYPDTKEGGKKQKYKQIHTFMLL